MPKIGFVTRAEYEERYGLQAHFAHVVCETPLHRGRAIQAVVVIALQEGTGSVVFGACKDCFKAMDNDLGPEANWHLLGLVAALEKNKR